MMHIIRFLVDWGQGGNAWNTEVHHFKSQAEECHLNTPWPAVWALKIMQQIIPSEHSFAFNFYEIFLLKSIVSGTSPFFCNPLGKCLENQQQKQPVFGVFVAGLLSKFTWLPAAAWSLLPASLRPSPRPCATVPWYRVLWSVGKGWKGY